MIRFTQIKIIKNHFRIHMFTLNLVEEKNFQFKIPGQQYDHLKVLRIFHTYS